MGLNSEQYLRVHLRLGVVAEVFPPCLVVTMLLRLERLLLALSAPLVALDRLYGVVQREGRWRWVQGLLRLERKPLHPVLGLSYGYVWWCVCARVCVRAHACVCMPLCVGLKSHHNVGPTIWTLKSKRINPTPPYLHGL